MGDSLQQKLSLQHALPEIWTSCEIILPFYKNSSSLSFAYFRPFQFPKYSNLAFLTVILFVIASILLVWYSSSSYYTTVWYSSFSQYSTRLVQFLQLLYYWFSIVLLATILLVQYSSFSYYTTGSVQFLQLLYYWFSIVPLATILLVQYSSFSYYTTGLVQFLQL